MTTLTKINIEEVIGHFVEAELSLVNYWGGKVNQKMTGRIIFSEYNASLFFMPKGSKNKGYTIDEDDILYVNIIRKDKTKHEYYVNAYNQREKAELKLEDRLEEEQRQREENARLRKEEFERVQREKEEAKQREIESAKQLGGYEELENEVIAFYESTGEFYNENTVKTIFLPILNKLIHKSITNVNDYPKHYFGKNKNGNPRFCKLIEKYLEIKLPSTQKASVEMLNEYLMS